MNGIKSIGIILLLPCMLVSYKSREPITETEPTIANNMNGNGDSIPEQAGGEGFEDGARFLFPSTGNNEDDFIKNSNFEISKHAEGFLNNDSLTDRVLLVEDRDDNRLPRAILVLTQQKDHTYRLVAKKETLSEIQDVKIADHSLTIVKLVIDKQYTNYWGTHCATFTLDHDTLCLQSLGASFFGVGGQLDLAYLVKQQKLKELVVNSMKDPAIVKVDSFNYVTSIPKGFENMNTDSIIESIMGKKELEFKRLVQKNSLILRNQNHSSY